LKSQRRSQQQQTRRRKGKEFFTQGRGGSRRRKDVHREDRVRHCQKSVQHKPADDKKNSCKEKTNVGRKQKKDAWPRGSGGACRLKKKKKNLQGHSDGGETDQANCAGSQKSGSEQCKVLGMRKKSRIPTPGRFSGKTQPKKFTSKGSVGGKATGHKSRSRRPGPPRHHVQWANFANL